jgi:hypothetical protein
MGAAPCKQNFRSSKKKGEILSLHVTATPPGDAVLGRLAPVDMAGGHGRWTWLVDKANAFRPSPLKSLASLISTQVIGCIREPQTQCFVPI